MWRTVHPFKDTNDGNVKGDIRAENIGYRVVNAECCNFCSSVVKSDIKLPSSWYAEPGYSTFISVSISLMGRLPFLPPPPEIES